MKVYSIDLYDYYKIKKPQGGAGELVCYIPGKSTEIDANRKNPAMLVIPGGAYAYTSFREDEPVALKYLTYGFYSFVLRYSVAPVKYPYALAEAIMAMNYLRSNADELGIDGEKIAAVGFSAGGHLTATLGSYYYSPEALEIFKPEFSARPDAVILGYPVITSGEKAHVGSFDNLCGTENLALREKLSVENLINEKSSPAFIWATYDDGAVPVKNSLLAATAYEKVGVPFSIHIFGKGQHGLSLADENVYGDVSSVHKTESVGSWVYLSVEWLKELGIKI